METLNSTAREDKMKRYPIAIGCALAVVVFCAVARNEGQSSAAKIAPTFPDGIWSGTITALSPVGPALQTQGLSVMLNGSLYTFADQQIPLVAPAFNRQVGIIQTDGAQLSGKYGVTPDQCPARPAREGDNRSSPSLSARK